MKWRARYRVINTIGRNGKLADLSSEKRKSRNNWNLLHAKLASGG
jgi:hypothetical protein